ncbi:MAG: hypothetical protein K6E78_06550 [Treponema sp.]|nr:hypothetical protein [Treponema sp.]
MVKKIIFSLIVISATLIMFTACPEEYFEPGYRERGQSIENFPDWAKDVLASEWKPWNTEETSEFKKLFKQKDSLNSTNINYRLFIDAQNIILFFDDEERTFCNPLMIWVAEFVGSGDYFISIPQKKDDEFIFTGHAKSNPAENNTDENKAYVKLSLIDKEAGLCSYLLKVNDKVIIDEKLKAYYYKKDQDISYTYFMETFGFVDKERKYDTCYMFRAPTPQFYLSLTDNRFVSNAFLYFEGLKQPPLYDEKSKTLTYELLGGTENMCHYLDVHYVNKDEIICSYYDFAMGEKKVKYTELLDTDRKLVYEY